ncbi:hypothetical protein ACFWP2_24075 [Kitasatospora sp. NPDC058444]|uniref:hypothetical protein n=1 Tax=Kitasatospora sp. NPDC058444 TaxID=3346504 RepID=UPI003661E6BD
MTRDSVTRSYVERCLEEGSALRDLASRVPFPKEAEADYRSIILPRPVFVPDRSIARCADDLAALFRVLTSLPDRLFGGDVDGYARELGIDPRRAALIQRLGGDITLYGRADLYRVEDSFKLLEFNVNSTVGGVSWSDIAKYMLEVPEFREFADEHGLDYVHTGERLVRSLREAAKPVTGGAAPVVGAVDCDGAMAKYRSMYLSLQEMMRGFGIEMVLGELSEVREKGGRLYLHGRPLDVIARYFTVEEVVASPDGERTLEPIFRAHEEGRVVLWTTMRTGLVHNKGCLAMLSDQRWRDAFSAEEKALIDRILPWTRVLDSGTVEAGGTTVDLLDYCGEHREKLIIKPVNGYSGIGSHAGWEKSDREWRELLDGALGSGYIVQERVVPDPEPIVDPESGTVEDYDSVWGVFVTPEGYGGAQVRATPSGGQAVINLGADRRVKVGPVFRHAS